MHTRIPWSRPEALSGVVQLMQQLSSSVDVGRFSDLELLTSLDPGSELVTGASNCGFQVNFF